MNPLTIVGGGMAGLATAWAAQRAGRPYRLFEASDRLGGKILSHRRDGFLLEGGPDSFLVEKPEGLDLCRELGLADQFIPSGGRAGQPPNVRILFDGELVPLPAGCRLFIPTDPELFRRNTLLSPAGTERALAEIDIPPRAVDAPDESVAAFVTRRFGSEMLERVAGPVLAGIYGADPHKLSLQASFGKFARLEREHGSLMRALAPTSATPKPGKRPAPFMSLASGMQTMIDSLVPKLTGEIHLDHPVGELDDSPTVLAVPAAVAANLLEDIDSELATMLRELRTETTATVNLAYDRSAIEAPEGFGFMSVLDDPSPLVGCTWVSNKFDQRSPPDGFLARAFVGGQKDQSVLELPDDELARLVHRELARLHPGLNTTTPQFSLVTRWLQGNPQYHVGHRERIAAIRARLPAHIRLLGSPYDGVGLSDIIRGSDSLFQSGT